MIWEAIILAAGIVVAAIIVSNTIENLVVDLAQDVFTRWDVMIYEDDED